MNGELIVALTQVVREADKDFENEGGSSRHWVRDCFLPRLEAAGLKVEYVVKARRSDVLGVGVAPSA